MGSRGKTKQTNKLGRGGGSGKAEMREDGDRRGGYGMAWWSIQKWGESIVGNKSANEI